MGDFMNCDWDIELAHILSSQEFKDFLNRVRAEYASKTVYPPKNLVFNALRLTPYKNVKVVILGQDPYHGVGEAHGLSFSVVDGVKLPPSLKNIYKELETDLGIVNDDLGDLTYWAKQGVLLLNSTLTVVKDTPNSHKDIGWQKFTDEVIKHLNNKETPVVFILWGAFARAKKVLITNKKHLIIESPHPSPFSAHHGFFGSKPFSKTNDFLIKNNIEPIDWQIKRK